MILMAVIRHYQLQAATNAYIAQLKSQGEPMDLASILPPPVPPEKNGADIVRQVASLLDTNTTLLKTNYDIPAMKMVAPGKAIIGWQQPDVREVDATNSWQEVGAAVAQNTNIFALLYQIIDKPDFDFQIQYSQGVDAVDFSKCELPQSKRATQWLSAAAVYHLHTGDTASAVDDVRAMLAVIQAMRDERFLISELVRIAISHNAAGSTWEILESPKVTDEQLAQLQHDWSNLEFIRSGENALAMERVTGRISLATWRASTSKFASYLDKGESAFEAADLVSGEETLWTKALKKPKILMWKYWWSYPDELLSLKGYEILLKSIRKAQSSSSLKSVIDDQTDNLYRLNLTNEDFFSSFSPNPNFHTMISEDIPSLGVLIRRVMDAEVAQKVVTTAIALKRYQLKHGNYPLDLDTLVPEFLPAVPLDSVDGNPLRYRLNPNGTYLLYSVGPNGKDDGGNPALDESVKGGNMSWLNNHALDWVWPQLATEAEIQNYWSHPKK